jgi:nitrous oxide reductase accessory protein NosL
MPSARFDQILEMLREKKSVSPQEIKEKYGVSLMTAYRDIHDLVEAGYARKVRGAIRLSQTPITSPDNCAYCGGMVSPRNIFTLQLEEQKKINACCAHCGLSLLARHPNIAAAVVADFLRGTTINVRQAHYVVEANFIACCSPSVLAFANIDEAQRFCNGFGGRVLDLVNAVEYVRSSMSLKSLVH